MRNMRQLYNRVTLTTICLLVIACAGTSTAVRQVTETKLSSDGKQIFLSFADIEGSILKGYFDPSSISHVVDTSPGYSDGSVAGALGALIGQAIVNSGEVKRNQAAAENRRNEIVSVYNSDFRGFELDKIKQKLVEQSISLKNGAASRGFLDYDAKKNEYAAGDYIVLITPTVLMPENKDTLMCETRVQVYDSSLLLEPLYDNDIKVVSSRVNSKNIEDYWSENDYEALASTGEQLMLESILIAHNIILDKLKEGAEKTHKYWFDGDRKFERGAEYSSRCGLTLVRNLRGNYLAFPNDEACEEE